MIKFINAESDWEHVKRLLKRNAPVETRATEHDNLLYTEYYNGHSGKFIIGAVFTNVDKGGKGGVFVRSLPGPVGPQVR